MVKGRQHSYKNKRKTGIVSRPFGLDQSLICPSAKIGSPRKKQFKVAEYQWTTSLLLLRFHQLCPWFMGLDSAVHPQWPNLHLLLTACNDLLKTHENIQYSLWSLSILEFVIDFSLSYWITDCVCERVFRTRVADMSLQTLKYDLKNSVNRFRI